MIFSTKKSRYVAGWEIDFDNPDELTKILLTQGIDKDGFELFSRIQSATELIIKDKRIIEVIQHSNGSKESEKTEYRLPIIDWVDRSPFYLHKDLNGSHTIGGKKPESFELPFDKELKSPFVYFATIDGKDPLFNWINLEKLHIAYPLYEGSFEIFLDYQNPNAPSIINPEIFNYSWIDEKVKGVENVQFVKQNYKARQKIAEKEVEANEEDFLLSGVPLWYQYPQIPTCPKSGKVMQFVTTINSDKSLVLNNNSGIENLPFGDYLIFGDYGHLYVFYEPDSKVLCLNVQF